MVGDFGKRSRCNFHSQVNSQLCRPYKTCCIIAKYPRKCDYCSPIPELRLPIRLQTQAVMS